MAKDKKDMNSKPKSNVKISNKKIVTKAKKTETKVASTKKQTKKKKGFTLVELIAVVGLLAILTTMTALSVSSINLSIKSRQKNTLLNSIQVAAEKYVNDTGIKKVYVDTLIKEGYVSADDYDSTTPVIVDPTDENQNLNCYLYDFTEAGKGKYIEPGDTSSTDCDMKPLSDVMLTIQYKIGSGAFNDYDGSWIKEENVTLGVRSNNTSIVDDSDISNHSTWTTPLAPDVYHSPSGTYSLAGDIEDGYLNATYQVTVAKDGATYTASKFIRIDSKAPIITNVRVDNPDEWAISKYMYFDLEDTGSGLAAYAISTNSNPLSLSSGDWRTISDDKKILSIINNSSENELIENGTYYVHAKDKAGNIKTSAGILVEKIDHIKPTCTLTGDSTTWTNADRTITWGCRDDETGCAVGYTGSSKTYTVSTKTDTLASYIVKDNAGNETVCPAKTVNVYVDKDKPQSVSLSIDKRSGYSYNSKYAHYTITASDVIPGKSSELASGIEYYCFTNSTSSSGCSWQTANSADITFDANEGSGTSYTRYAYVKDKAGNISNAVSNSYTLYKLCEKKTADSSYNYKECSKKCGTGTQSRPMKDYYLGGDANCGLGDERNCNTQDCCSLTEVNEDDCTGYKWTDCTAPCGGGTKYEKNVCGYKSSYDGSTCPGTKTYTRNEGTSCNTQSCCDEGTYSYYGCNSSGYAIYRRYNGCINEYQSYVDYDDYCKSELNCQTQDCPWDTINKTVEEMTVSRVCSYYYGGEYNEYTDGVYYCDYGNRYFGCDSIYVGRCYGNYSSSLCEHGWNKFGTEYGQRSAYQVERHPTCNWDVIEGDRYWCSPWGTQSVYIFACYGTDSDCLYHTTGYDPWYGDFSITDILYRGDLRTGSDAC